MIKRLLVVLSFCLPFSVFCQEIKSNDVDPFTNERTIQTTLVSIKEGLSSGFGISYTAINNSYYLNIIGYSSRELTITEDDKIWLVLDDGNVVQFNDKATVEDDGSDVKNIFIYHFFAKLTDIEILKNKRVALVRISSPDGSLTDVKISKKCTKEVQKLNEVFFKEVNKAEL